MQDDAPTPLMIRLGDVGAMSMIVYLLLFVVLFGAMFLMMPAMIVGGLIDAVLGLPGLFTMLITFLSMALMFLSIAAMMMVLFVGLAHWIWCILLVAKMPLADNDRMTWLLIVVMTGMIGAPIFWFMKGREYAKLQLVEGHGLVPA